jgi:hypothetical protein
MTTEYTPNFQLAMPDFRTGPWHDLINNDMLKIDALLYGGLSQGNVDVWKNSTQYTPGISVIDGTDATVWMCVLLHVSAPAPTTFAQDRAAHPTYWTRLLTGFAPRGEWAQNTQYFPYDLAYDSHRGIMALCTFGHISTATGSIITDQEKWAFLLDMSSVQGVVLASAVSYSNAASGIPYTNVQSVIDYLEQQIVAMNNINVTQGNNISSLSNYNATQDATIAALTTRVTNTESKNATQDGVDSSLQGQINSLAASIPATPPPAFPSGTIMCFFQNYPPTGWNQVNGWSDRAIKIVDAGGGGGDAGGAVGWSGIFNRTNVDGYALTPNDLPSHYHPLGIVTATVRVSEDGPGSIEVTKSVNPYTNDTQTGPVGADQVHIHNIEMRLAYINVCIGQKQ